MGDEFFKDKVSCFNLTHPQKRILYTEKLYLNTGVGNLAFTVKLKDTIDFSKLEEAIY